MSLLDTCICWTHVSALIHVSCMLKMLSLNIPVRSIRVQKQFVYETFSICAWNAYSHNYHTYMIEIFSHDIEIHTYLLLNRVLQRCCSDRLIRVDMFNMCWYVWYVLICLISVDMFDMCWYVLICLIHVDMFDMCWYVWYVCPRNWCDIVFIVFKWHTDLFSLHYQL